MYAHPNRNDADLAFVELKIARMRVTKSGTQNQIVRLSFGTL